MKNTPDHIPTHETLSSRAAMNVAALKEQLAREIRVAVNGKVAVQILGCSVSQLANHVRDGRIPSFLDGTRRLYPVLPLYEHLISKAIASHPLGGAPLKARHPTGQFKKGYAARQRSAAQREALKRGNEIRIARARARRAREEAQA